MFNGKTYEIKNGIATLKKDVIDKEKETSVNLVVANAVNLNGTVGNIDFVNSFEIVKEVL